MNCDEAVLHSNEVCVEAILNDETLQRLRAAAQALDQRIANGPIVPAVTPLEIRDYLGSRYSFQRAMPLDQLVRDVEEMLQHWQVQVTHPHYFGLFNPSVTFASAIADLLVAIYNPQLATWRTSPAANEIERHTLRWLSAKFGLPNDAVSNFTSGGQESNLSAVYVALVWAFPEFRDGGLRRLAVSPVFYVSAGAHHGFSRIASLTGLGCSSLRIVSVNRDGQMDMSDLSRKVAEDRRAGLHPFMVVGTAGSTAAGAIDPLADLAGFCRERNLWFHVDAAWGGAAAISPRLGAHLAGIDQAESITCDAHKWFSVPMGAGMFFCRHRAAVVRAFASEIAFMPDETADAMDPYRATVQWSRRFIGLKLFLSLAEKGEAGFAEMIDHQAAMGELLRTLLARTGWRIVNQTPLPVVCFTRDDIVPSCFSAHLQRRQIAWISPVQLDGGVSALRACITSFRTTAQDIESLVEQLNTLLNEERTVA